jgi:PAS domain S-box-containing protein
MIEEYKKLALDILADKSYLSESEYSNRLEEFVKSFSVPSKIENNDKLKELNEELNSQNEEYYSLMEEYRSQNDKLNQSFQLLEKYNQEVSKSERKYSLLFNQLTSGFALHKIVCNQKGEVVDYIFEDVNPMFEKLTGLNKEKILGKRVLEIMPNTESYWIEKYGEVAKTMVPTMFENYSKELDKFFEVYAYAPEKNYFAVLFVDISERKKNEIKIKEAEIQLNALFNSSPSVMILMDKNRNVIRINKAGADYCLQDMSDIIGSILGFAISCIYFEGDKCTGNSSVICNECFLKTKIEETIETGQNLSNLEYKLHRRKGFEAEVVDLLVNISSFYIENEPVVLLAINDISILKKLQLNLINSVIETQEAERKRFAADLHDEIGPLLSSLKLYIEALRTNVDAQKVVLISENAMNLINDLITLTREISNNLSPGMLNEFGLDASVNTLIINNRNHIRIDYESNINKVRFEKNIELAFYRILKELVNNTLKHGRAENITLRLTFTNNKLEMSYSDDGIGMQFDKVLSEKMSLGLKNIIMRSNTIAADYYFFKAENGGFGFSLSKHDVITLNHIKK